MKCEITDIDSGSPELFAAVPIRAQLLKRLTNPDGSDYLLAELESSIRKPDGQEITHLILGGRMAPIHHGMKDRPVNIAYVIDPSLLDDDTLDFAKGEFVGIGFATDLTDDG